MNRLLVMIIAIAFPFAATAATKTTHIKTENQDCVECHSDQEQAWLGGKHGLMNVKCVVCHGSPEENFFPKPAMTRCRGCHGEKVADVEAKLPAKDRSCFLCHENHSVTVKETARIKTGFHGAGGTK